MKRTIKLSLFVFLTVAMLGMAVAPGIAQDYGGGTITWGVKTEATGIDVQTNGNSPSRQLFNFVYEQLVDMDEDLNVLPGLAESWEQVDDTTYPLPSAAGGTLFQWARDDSRRCRHLV